MLVACNRSGLLLYYPLSERADACAHHGRNPRSVSTRSASSWTWLSGRRAVSSASASILACAAASCAVWTCPAAVSAARSPCRPRPIPAGNCIWEEASATCHATMWRLRDAPEDPTVAGPWEGLPACASADARTDLDRVQAVRHKDS